jgi:hypothetical protein
MLRGTATDATDKLQTRTDMKVVWVTGLRGEHTELEIESLKADWGRFGCAGSVEWVV